MDDELKIGDTPLSSLAGAEFVEVTPGERWDYPVEHGLAVSDESFRAWGRSLAAALERLGMRAVDTGQLTSCDGGYVWAMADIEAAMRTGGAFECVPRDEVRVTTCDEAREWALRGFGRAMSQGDVAQTAMDLIDRDEFGPPADPVQEIAASVEPEPPSHRHIPDPDLVDPGVDVMAMVRRFS